ncbi:hypothetical protein BN1221_01462c [Brenneria goodwinii]|uniref:Uncharacterized protein n=1 Tax=Brenneria goodwinii TaxID=1109412 RepID=A0A0G4JT22_9GAMM|nr:hypothetical protein BN1221_01462c [Brenneria goodwinii]
MQLQTVKSDRCCILGRFFHVYQKLLKEMAIIFRRAGKPGSAQSP